MFQRILIKTRNIRLFLLKVFTLLFMVAVSLVIGLMAVTGQKAPDFPPSISQPFEDPSQPLSSLKSVPVQEPDNLADFVLNKEATIQLGKVLFWDTQVGSDGKTACASCHFQAGADVRTKNAINPGLNGNFTTFTFGGPNNTLNPANFPFTKHIDENMAGSAIKSDTPNIAASQGVFFRGEFVDQNGFDRNTFFLSMDTCQKGKALTQDAIFNVKGNNVRRVVPRNSPSVINAVFNYRNFWDGRAQNEFNGVNPFGTRDPGARIWKQVNGQLQQVTIRLDHASLASQAVGPPGSTFEMSCSGRTFEDIGARLLDPTTRPLALQIVSPTDSVLGNIANSKVTKNFPGITLSYAQMVKKAFRPEYWQGSATQMQQNFSLFFGLSIMAYESTLVADNSPVDQYYYGNKAALTPQQINGMVIFQGQGKCINCHAGPETTGASVRLVSDEARLERMSMGNGFCAIYDQGFYNIGVRPTTDDKGLGGSDPFGNPLSMAGLAVLGKLTDPFLIPAFGQLPNCDNKPNVNGTFKTPGLRNVELTGPYFHNGGKATLRQVVDFYSRGGDFAATNIDNLDPEIGPLNLTSTEKDALVAFLIGMTDERVRWEKAPFDHPSICMPNGEVGNQTALTLPVMDQFICLNAVGAEGNSTPLKPFLGLNPYNP